MVTVRGLLWYLFIWYLMEMHLCEKDCTNQNSYGCDVDIIDMTAGEGAKLLRLIENESNVYIWKLIVAISPAGPFLQKISHVIAVLTFVNFREPAFHIPEGNTISEIEIMRATNLRAFVAGPNTHLEKLVIQHCMLDRLPQTLSKMSRIKQLSITNCLLSVLRLEMFVECQNLSTLDLSYNQIRQIIPVTSSATLSIEKLVLTGNQLERLDMSVFASIPKLVALQVFENRLTRIEVSRPVTLPLLSSLVLGDNMIEIFDLRNLTLPSLSILSLSSNALKQMPFLPKMLPELYYLAVGENNLTHLDLSYFRPYRKLKDIYMTSNQISTVRTSSPVTLPLTWLNLGKNRITFFNITGCGLPNMTSLNLGSNRLKVIPPVFERFPKVSMIMDGNPLTCDTLLPYKDKIQNGMLSKDKVSLSRACDTTSSFIIGEKIKVCCDS